MKDPGMLGGLPKVVLSDLGDIRVRYVGKDVNEKRPIQHDATMPGANPDLPLQGRETLQRLQRV